YLPADARDELTFHIFSGSHEHITGGRTHDLAQVIRFNLSPNRAHMRVESAHTDNHVVGDSEFSRPFSGFGTGSLIGGISVFKESCGKSCKKGIKGGEEFIRWKATEFFRPQRLVARGADAAFHFVNVVSPGKHKRDPVAMLHPRIARLPDIFIRAKDAQQLRPKPLGRINATHIFEVISVEVFCVPVDFGGLGRGSVVFPQDEHGVWILFKSREKRQGRPGFVDRDRRRTRGVDGDTLYGGGYLTSRNTYAIFDGVFESFEVIEGVLSELVVLRAGVLSVAPSRVVKYRRCYFGTIAGIHNHSPHRIGSEVYSYNKSGHISNYWPLLECQGTIFLIIRVIVTFITTTSFPCRVVDGFEQGIIVVHVLGDLPDHHAGKALGHRQFGFPLDCLNPIVVYRVELIFQRIRACGQQVFVAAEIWASGFA